jgi:hypothetical protein
MVTEAQREQQDRLEVTLQDADLRRQQQQKEPPNTLHQHALASANDTVGGRFAALGNPHVVGSAPIPKYPELPANSPSHFDPVPNEPPLGFAIDEMPVDSSTSPFRRGSGDPTNAQPVTPIPGERVGSPLSQSDTDDNGEID